jgi:undecaprenyl-diphosphatase
MNVLIVFAAKYLFLVSILIFGWFFFTLPSTLKKKFATFTLAAFMLSFALAKLLSTIFNDPRPFVSDLVTPLISHAADNGFPSDHTLLTMTIASVVFIYNRKLGILLAGTALVVGFARILAGVHHTIDVLGAVAIAITSVAMIRVLNKKNEIPFQHEE